MCSTARRHRWTLCIAALLALLCASRGTMGTAVPSTTPSNACRRLQADSDDGVLRLGLLLPLTGWSAGRYIVGAATLAIEDINNSPLLQGRCVDYAVEDEGCKAIIGTTALSRLLQKHTIHAVIGASCSVACLPTGYLSAGSNLPQVSNGCSAGPVGPSLFTTPATTRQRPCALEIGARILGVQMCCQTRWRIRHSSGPCRRNRCTSTR
jgi:ABC-type branched-subunit amino acid transport system substrate-binding protein